MFNKAGLKGELRENLWDECFQTAMYLSNISIDTLSKVSNYKKYHGERPKVKLRTFGEMTVVNNSENIQSKIKNKGNLCMFVGYSQNRSLGT